MRSTLSAAVLTSIALAPCTDGVASATNPGGRRIEVAVSRLPATGDRTGVILANPGGPGQPGVTMPSGLAGSRAGGLNAHHDLIGFDPRGAGYSTAIACERDTTQPDPAWSPKERRFTAERDAARTNPRRRGDRG